MVGKDVKIEIDLEVVSAAEVVPATEAALEVAGVA